MSEININDSGFSPFEAQQTSTNTANETKSSGILDQKKLDKLMKSVKSQKNKEENEERSDKSNDDPKVHQSKINQINRYFASKYFGKMLRDMKYESKTETLMKKTVKELEDQIARMQYSVANNNNADSSKLIFKFGLPIVESILDPIYPCRGFSSALLNPKNEDFEKLLEEYSLQHEAIYLSPFMRIAGTVAVSILTANKCHEILAKQQQISTVESSSNDMKLPKSNAVDAGYVALNKSELPASNINVMEVRKSDLPETNVNKIEIVQSSLPPSNVVQ